MKWGWTEENTHRVVKLALLVLQMRGIRPTLPKQGQRQPFAGDRDHPSITNSFSTNFPVVLHSSVLDSSGEARFAASLFPSQMDSLTDRGKTDSRQDISHLHNSCLFLDTCAQ